MFRQNNNNLQLSQPKKSSRSPKSLGDLVIATLVFDEAMGLYHKNKGLFDTFAASCEQYMLRPDPRLNEKIVKCYEKVADIYDVIFQKLNDIRGDYEEAADICDEIKLATVNKTFYYKNSGIPKFILPMFLKSYKDYLRRFPLQSVVTVSPALENKQTDPALASRDANQATKEEKLTLVKPKPGEHHRFGMRHKLGILNVVKRELKFRRKVIESPLDIGTLKDIQENMKASGVEPEIARQFVNDVFDMFKVENEKVQNELTFSSNSGFNGLRMSLSREVLFDTTVLLSPKSPCLLAQSRSQESILDLSLSSPDSELNDGMIRSASDLTLEPGLRATAETTVAPRRVLSGSSSTTSFATSISSLFASAEKTYEDDSDVASPINSDEVVNLVFASGLNKGIGFKLL